MLDTKWKALRYAAPSNDDLKQMYVYNHHFEAEQSILLYPQVFGVEGIVGHYHERRVEEHGCQLLFLDIFKSSEGQVCNNLPTDLGVVLKHLVMQAISLTAPQ